MMFLDKFLDALFAGSPAGSVEPQVKAAYDMGFHDGRLCRPLAPRPCEVDGEPGTFHGFTNNDKALLRLNVFLRPEEQERLWRRFRADGYVPSGGSTEVARSVCALVEFSDGSVRRVDPEDLRFTDLAEV